MKLLLFLTFARTDKIGSHVEVKYYEQALHAKLFGGKDWEIFPILLFSHWKWNPIKAEIWNGSASVMHEFEQTYNKKAHPIDIGKAEWYKDSNWSDYKKFW